jgi:hypothetical protein
VVFGELPRLDLEAVVPVPASEALSKVAGNGHRARFPLFEDMAVLMEYQRGVFEELLGTVAKVNASAAGGRNRAQVQPREQRVLDDFHLIDVGAEQARKGCTDMTGQDYAAAETESHGRQHD